MKYFIRIIIIIILFISLININSICSNAISSNLEKVRYPNQQINKNNTLLQILLNMNSVNTNLKTNKFEKYKEGSIIEDIKYKSIDNKELKLDIYMPNIIKYEKAPVIVYVHGGFWAFGDKKSEIPYLIDTINKLRDKGFTVVSIDYRLSNSTTKFPAPIEDVKDAVKFIKKNASKYNLDENKIGIWGSSAGGHLALMEGLTDDTAFIGSDEFKNYSSKVNFIISWYGPTDLSIVKGKNAEKVADNFLGVSIKDSKDNYIKASPINYISKESPSILLIHGSKDTVVPSSQSYNLYKKGKELGADVRYMSIKNGGHGFIPSGGELYPTLNDISDKTISFIEENFKN